MKGKELKIVLQNKVNNFLLNAYFLCIIMAHENLYPWFYENYIQLYYNDKKQGRYGKKEIWLDFYGGWTEPQKLLDFIKIPRKTFESTNILTYIKRNIDEGLYVFTYFDEYYVKPNYTESGTHFVHDILVYGYNDLDKELSVLGFDDNRAFVSYKVPYVKFIMAFEKGLELTNTDESWNMDAFYGRLFGVKSQDSGIYSFDCKRFADRLGDYIYSVNTVKKDYPDYDRDNPVDYCEIYLMDENVFGMDIYKHLPQYMEEVLQSKDLLFYTAFHTLYEHKVCMMDKLNYISTRFNLHKELDEILESYGHITSVFNSIRLTALKYNRCRKENLLREIIPIIGTETENEKDVLSRAYDVISRTF